VTTIGVINYGSGNFASVMNALEHLELNVLPVEDSDAMSRATHLVLPGVGAFGTAMDRLNERSLVEPLIEEVVEKKTPFLGICVGMQVLADFGLEFERNPGLGFVSGITEEIGAAAHNLSVPHVGWNDVRFHKESPLFDGFDEETAFYFVHSYHLMPENSEDILGTSEYGDEVVAAVQRDNIYGVQFHPEKSQVAGLKVLKNFAEIPGRSQN
jgi:glutamine amidotransferase